MNLTFLKAHAFALIKLNRIKFEPILTTPNWVNPFKKPLPLIYHSHACFPNIVRATPVKGELSYITLLHEIGHVVLNHVDNYSAKDRLDCEYEAWFWAEKQALKMTPNMKRFEMTVLGNYHRLLDKSSRVHLILHSRG